MYFFLLLLLCNWLLFNLARNSLLCLGTYCLLYLLLNNRFLYFLFLSNLLGALCFLGRLFFMMLLFLLLNGVRLMLLFFSCRSGFTCSFFLLSFLLSSISKFLHQLLHLLDALCIRLNAKLVLSDR